MGVPVRRVDRRNGLILEIAQVDGVDPDQVIYGEFTVMASRGGALRRGASGTR